MPLFQHIQQIFALVVPQGADPRVRYCGARVICLVMVWFFIQGSGGIAIVDSAHPLSDSCSACLLLLNLGSQCMGGIIGSLIVLAGAYLKRTPSPTDGQSQPGDATCSRIVALTCTSVLVLALVGNFACTVANLSLASAILRVVACVVVTVLFLEACLTLAGWSPRTALAVFFLVSLCRIVQNLIMLPFEWGAIWAALSLIVELALVVVYTALTLKPLNVDGPNDPNDGAAKGLTSLEGTPPRGTSRPAATSLPATVTDRASRKSAATPSEVGQPPRGGVPLRVRLLAQSAAKIFRSGTPPLGGCPTPEPDPHASQATADDASKSKRYLPWQFIAHVMLYYFVIGVLRLWEGGLATPGLQINCAHLLASTAAFGLFYASFVRTGSTSTYWVRIRQIVFPLLVTSCALTGLLPSDLLFLAIILGQTAYRFFLLSSYVEMFSICDITNVNARHVFAVTHLVMYVGMLAGGVVGLGSQNFAENQTVVLATTLLLFLCLTAASCWLGNDKSAGKVWGRRIELTPKGRHEELLAETCQVIAESYHLTAKETEVLEHLARKQSLDQIATELVVSKNTVRTHVRNLYAKVGAHSQSDIYKLFDETKAEIKQQ